MKLFEELNRLGYRHYTENTIEELDDLPLNARERIMEQALALRWFREKHGYYASFFRTHDDLWAVDVLRIGVHKPRHTVFSKTYEEAELACLARLIEIANSAQDSRPASY